MILYTHTHTPVLKRGEKGITLVALLITIIIMIILAAITIKVIFDIDFINLATKSVENYSDEQIKEEKEFNEISNTLDKSVKKIQGEEVKEEREKLEPTEVWVKLYTDGTLMLSSFDYLDTDRILDTDYGEITKKHYTDYPEWDNKNKEGKIKEVKVYDKIAPTSTAYWFGTISPNGIEHMDLKNLYTNNVTNMQHMFIHCDNLNVLDVSHFDTQNVTNMIGMFAHCINLKELKLNNFDTRNVTEMSAMFGNCTSLTKLELGKFDTRNVIDMAYMFWRCSSLTELDVSTFDTRNVIEMTLMFSECTSLTELDISTFTMDKETNISSMFSGSSKLKNIYVKNEEIKTLIQEKASVPTGCNVDFEKV